MCCICMRIHTYTIYFCRHVSIHAVMHPIVLLIPLMQKCVREGANRFDVCAALYESSL